MNAISSFLVFTLILLIISCGRTKGDNTIAADQSKTEKAIFDTMGRERLENRKQIEDQEKIESLNHEKILNEAIIIAEKHKAEDKFNYSYLEIMPDSSYEVEVNISCGFHFSNQFTHLIIRRTTRRFVYLDIFLKADNQFQKVLSHEQWTLEYTEDTISDINGDGLKDFVVNWYGSTGCCLKAFSNVYLQRANKKTFSTSLEFINPTFSPEEKIIRGVCYGHPGETEMYKFKWNKETVDTVEYIYYEKNDKGQKTGKVIVSSNLPNSENHKVLKQLSNIPEEYRKIEGYDWFTNNLDESGNR